MRILGIESSCDETAAAVVEDGRRLLSNVVHSQIDIHALYGGVIPEVAARSHIEMINPVIARALEESDSTWDDIDAIAVTYAPGLIGSLLVGTLAARTLAILHHKPLYAIHHVEAHVYANFIVESIESAKSLASNLLSEVLATSPDVSLETSASDKTVTGRTLNSNNKTLSASHIPNKTYLTRTDSKSPLTFPSAQPAFPMLALIVSGGHSQLVLFKDRGDYTLLGQTQDDAVGEAFDKVAKILGLPYPGGPSITQAALSGDAHKYTFPKAKLAGKYDFSFSGLKTAVLRAVQREVGVDFTFPSHELAARLTAAQQHDFAASFQHIAIETLVDKTMIAYRDYTPASVVISGGVAANQELRRQLAARLPIAIEYAPIQLCTDNAAMIATLAYFQAQRVHPADPYSLEVQPSLSMVNNTTV